MNKKQAKKMVKKLINTADVTKKTKKQFKQISQQLSVSGCYFAPNIIAGELTGWDLMKDGLNWSFLTDELSFNKLKLVAWNIDDILKQPV